MARTKQKTKQGSRTNASRERDVLDVNQQHAADEFLFRRDVVDESVDSELQSYVNGIWPNMKITLNAATKHRERYVQRVLDSNF